jgi:hypothetical protein
MISKAGWEEGAHQAWRREVSGVENETPPSRGKAAAENKPGKIRLFLQDEENSDGKRQAINLHAESSIDEKVDRQFILGTGHHLFSRINAVTRGFNQKAKNRCPFLL